MLEFALPGRILSSGSISASCCWSRKSCNMQQITLYLSVHPPLLYETGTNRVHTRNPRAILCCPMVSKFSLSHWLISIRVSPSLPLFLSLSSSLSFFDFSISLCYLSIYIYVYLSPILSLSSLFINLPIYLQYLTPALSFSFSLPLSLPVLSLTIIGIYAY